MHNKRRILIACVSPAILVALAGLFAFNPFSSVAATRPQVGHGEERAESSFSQPEALREGAGIGAPENFAKGTRTSSFLPIPSASGKIQLNWYHARVDSNLPAICVQLRTNLLSGDWEYAGKIYPADGMNSWTNNLLPNAYYRICVTNMS